MKDSLIASVVSLVCTRSCSLRHAQVGVRTGEKNRKPPNSVTLGISLRCIIYASLLFTRRRRHTRCKCDWSSDVCSSDLHHSHGVDMSWAGGEPTLGSVYSRKLTDTFGGHPRLPRREIQQEHSDLACSVQRVLEENYYALLNHVQKHTGQKAVCLAGGVALNCVANGMIFEKTDFRDVFIQPAAHDAGTAIGAALYVQHQILHQPRSFVMRHVYYGPEYGDSDIRAALGEAGASWHKLVEDQLIARAPHQIPKEKIAG